MTPLPLDQLRFGWRSHVSALYWLALLYRKPWAFVEAMVTVSRTSRFVSGLICYAHSVPYIFLIAVVGRVVLRIFGVASGDGFIGAAWGIAGGIAFGIAGGIAFGIAFGIATEIATGIAAGIAGGIAGGIAFGIAGGFAFGIAGGITIGIAGITGIAYGIAAGIAFGIAFTRLYYLPYLVLLGGPLPVGRWYRFHPVAWDSLCSSPMPWLERMLLAYHEHDRSAATDEIERLITEYPSQRNAAIRAKLRLLAREAAKVSDLTLLTAIANQLLAGDTGFLREVPAVRTTLTEIAEQQRRINATTRPAFREPQEDALRAKIEGFYHQAGGFRGPLSEFRPAAQKWLERTRREIAATIALIDIQPTQQVFRAGDPVDRNGEAFVPRLNVHGELERQIMMSTGCPGLILYGRRRMGKSTVLRNIVKYLPTSVRVVTMTMEDPQVFTSEEAFCRTLTQTILADQPAGDMAEIPAKNLRELKAFLDRHNSQLQQQAARLLLGIDEYQYLDEKIGQGVFTEGLLQTVRTSIQEHRNLTWVFAGSRALEELMHADWSSYLVSARTIEVQPFSLDETHQLLTEPLQESEAWKHNPRRPRFNPMFWGTGGIERIHNEAGGWPHLVQLIAETCVDLVNDREMSSVDETLLEDALHMSATRGDTVLRQLLERECHLDGEWDWIAKFRQLDVQPPPDDEAIYRSLRRRLIVAETDNGQWHLRVPLMLRWLRERG